MSDSDMNFLLGQINMAASDANKEKLRNEADQATQAKQDLQDKVVTQLDAVLGTPATVQDIDLDAAPYKYLEHLETTVANFGILTGVNGTLAEHLQALNGTITIGNSLAANVNSLYELTSVQQSGDSAADAVSNFSKLVQKVSDLKTDAGSYLKLTTVIAKHLGSDAKLTVDEIDASLAANSVLAKDVNAIIGGKGDAKAVVASLETLKSNHDAYLAASKQLASLVKTLNETKQFTLDKLTPEELGELTKKVAHLADDAKHYNSFVESMKGVVTGATPDTQFIGILKFFEHASATVKTKDPAALTTHFDSLRSNVTSCSGDLTADLIKSNAKIETYRFANKKVRLVEGEKVSVLTPQDLEEAVGSQITQLIGRAEVSMLKCAKLHYIGQDCAHARSLYCADADYIPSICKDAYDVHCAIKGVTCQPWDSFDHTETV